MYYLCQNFSKIPSQDVEKTAKQFEGMILLLIISKSIIHMQNGGNERSVNGSVLHVSCKHNDEVKSAIPQKSKQK